MRLPLLLPTGLTWQPCWGVGGAQEVWAYGISGQEILQETLTSKSSSSPPKA